MKNQANINSTETSRHSCGIAKQLARQESTMDARLRGHDGDKGDARLRGHDDNTENGNALVLILITIILLAALTFTFMRGDSGSSTTTLTKGEANIIVSTTIKYAKSMENAIKRMQLVNGCSENEISFENSEVAGYENANAPSDCWVFGLQGGGMSWQSPPEGLNSDGSDYYYSAVGSVRYLNEPTPEDELMILAFNINDSVCEEINARTGVGRIIPVDRGDVDEVQFIGDYTTGGETISGATTPLDCSVDPLCGEPIGCLKEENTGQRNILYYSLITRG